MKAIRKPRKNAKDDKNNLKNYMEIDQFEFDDLYRQFGSSEEVFKVVENGESVRYFVFAKFLKRKK